MKLTCVECPIGCEIEVDIEGEKIVKINGNNCPRGKAYAENEIICPRRVLTSTVKSFNGKMISVKTDAPIKKSEIFNVMDKINLVIVERSVAIGEIIVKNISEDI